MKDSDATNSKARFSIRSVLSLIAFAALGFTGLRQHQQSKQLQRRIEQMASEIEHLSASDEDLREKLYQLRDIVSDEPIMGLPLTQE